MLKNIQHNTGGWIGLLLIPKTFADFNTRSVGYTCRFQDHTMHLLQSLVGGYQLERSFDGFSR